MSDQVRCDICGTIGWRKMRRIAPEGWFYAEAKDEDNPENVIIVWACSEACRMAFWKPGPGFLDLTEASDEVQELQAPGPVSGRWEER